MTTGPDPAPLPVYDLLGVAWGTMLGPVRYADCRTGVEWTACLERVTVDGAAASAAVIRDGHILRLRTTVGPNVTVDVQRTMVGAIEAIDASTGVVTVLGQRMQLFSSPRWIVPEVTELPEGLLAVGRRIAVSGFFSGDGDVYPTRIEATTDTEDSVRGILLRDGTVWRIGELDLDLAGAVTVGFPASAPLPGDGVRVVGRRSRPDGPFVATALAYTGGDFPTQGATVWSLEGVVTAARSTTDFEVAGLRALVGNCNCSQFTAPPAPGASVVVHGGMRPMPGTVVWPRALITGHTLTGPLESIDTSAGTVTVLGFTVQMSDATIISSDTSISTWGRDPEALRVGGWVRLSADRNGGRLFAGIVTGQEPTEPRIETFGVTLEDPVIRVLDRPVLTGEDTTLAYCDGGCGWTSARALFTSGMAHYTTLTLYLESAQQPLRAKRIHVE